MTTSAQALSELFASISQETRTQPKFLAVAADRLGISGDDREAEALLIISRLIKRVLADIGELPLSDSEKKLLRANVGKFSGLIDFTHSHLDMENAKRNSITAENITGLIYVQMALSGHKKLAKLEDTSTELSKKFRELSNEISDTDLPEDLREAIIKRLQQIANMIDHFVYFGRDDLEREMTSLTGIIVLNAAAFDRADKSIVRRIFETLSATSTGIKRACELVLIGKATTDVGVEIYSKIVALIGN